MIKKLIRVPTNESYYFCKRIFFHIYGDIGSVFANKIDADGFICYPYYNTKDSESDPNLLVFCKETELDNIISFLNEYDTNIYCNYNTAIVITDAESMTTTQINFFDELVDLTSLQEYYQVELSLSSFIKNTLKINR